MNSKEHYENMETIEMVAATIIHEVKNPLALIQANVDFLCLDDKNEVHNKNYKVIKKEIEKANKLLLNLVDLVKVAYRMDEEVELYDVIFAEIENYAESFGYNINFDIDSVDKNIYFLGNRQLFSWAISNILKNSVEAIKDSGNIKVTATEENAIIKFVVEDDGEGISPDVLRKINADINFTTKESGSGMGLFICKDIIKGHGGEFNIESVEGQGCKVKIELPL